MFRVWDEGTGRYSVDPGSLSRHDLKTLWAKLGIMFTLNPKPIQ